MHFSCWLYKFCNFFWELYSAVFNYRIQIIGWVLQFLANYFNFIDSKNIKLEMKGI